MFVAHSKSTGFAVTKPTPSESEVFDALVKVHENVLKQSARGRMRLDTGGDITKKELLGCYEIKYAMGVWLLTKEVMVYPEKLELCVFYTHKNFRDDVPPMSGSYDPDSGLFSDRTYENEFTDEEIHSFLIIPGNDSV